MKNKRIDLGFILGLNSYQLAVKHGLFRGTLNDWINALDKTESETKTKTDEMNTTFKEVFNNADPTKLSFGEVIDARKYNDSLPERLDDVDKSVDVIFRKLGIIGECEHVTNAKLNKNGELLLEVSDNDNTNVTSIRLRKAKNLIQWKSNISPWKTVLDIHSVIPKLSTTDVELVNSMSKVRIDCDYSVLGPCYKFFMPKQLNNSRIVDIQDDIFTTLSLVSLTGEMFNLRVDNYGNLSIVNKNVDEHVPNLEKPIVMLIEESGRDTFNDELKPYWDEKEIPYAIAVNPTLIGTQGYYTLSDIKMIQYDSHDILNHGIGFASITEANADYYLNSAKSYFTNNGLTAGQNILVYPKGNHGDDKEAIIDITTDYYKYAFNTECVDEDDLVTKGLWNVAPYDYYNRRYDLRRVQITSNRSFDYYEDILDEVLANKGVVIFYIDSSDVNLDMNLVKKITNKISDSEFDVMSPSIALEKLEYVVAE